MWLDPVQETLEHAMSQALRWSPSCNGDPKNLEMPENWWNGYEKALVELGPDRPQPRRCHHISWCWARSSWTERLHCCSNLSLPFYSPSHLERNVRSISCWSIELLSSFHKSLQLRDLVSELWILRVHTVQSAGTFEVELNTLYYNMSSSC